MGLGRLPCLALFCLRGWFWDGSLGWFGLGSEAFLAWGAPPGCLLLCRLRLGATALGVGWSPRRCAALPLFCVFCFLFVCVLVGCQRGLLGLGSAFPWWLCGARVALGWGYRSGRWLEPEPLTLFCFVPLSFVRVPCLSLPCSCLLVPCPLVSVFGLWSFGPCPLEFL